MKYRPNLWSTVEKIQCSPDTKRNEVQRTVYIPDVHYKHNTKVFSDAERLDRELKNAFKL